MVPLARWFKKELKPLVADCLLAGNAPVDQAMAKQLMAEHCVGKADHSQRIWVLLMYTLWKNRERSGHLLQA
jgi:asparagine synthase (glutamine-hydrolysing)